MTFQGSVASDIPAGLRLAPGPHQEGPRPNLPSPARDIFGHLLGLADHYGELVRFKLGRQLYHLVTRPEDLDAIFVNDRTTWVRGATWAPLLEVAGRQGLLGSDGESWKQERRFAQPHFSGPVVAGERPALAASIRRQFAEWAGRPEPIPLLAAAKRLMFEVTAAKLFGAVPEPAEIAECQEAAAELDGLWNVPLQQLMHGRDTGAEKAQRETLRARLATVDPIIHRWIVRAAAAPDGAGGLLRHYARASGGGPDVAARLRDVSLTFLMTGFDTTASGFYWTVEQLLENPAAVATLHAEFAASPPDEALIPDFPWTVAVVSETLRLYPAVWYLAREATADTTLGGCHVPARSFALASPFVIHRQSRLWRDPLAFRPERFVPWAPEPVPGKAYLPFGLGARVCIGKHLALAQIALAVGILFRNYTVTRADTGPRVLAGDFTLRARDPIRVVLAPRASP